MKKKNLIKRLELKKTQVSNFQQDKIVGGSRFFCVPIDLSEIETCNPVCDYTVTCTQTPTCNDISFLNCTVYNCATNNCGTNNCGTNDCNPSGGISCPGYVC